MSFLRAAASAGVFALASVLALGGGACSGGDDDGDCNCPTTLGPTLVEVVSTCDEVPLVTASGPCTVASSGAAVALTGAGTCHVTVTDHDGTTASGDLVITADVLACGCGELLEVVGAEGTGATDQLTLAPAACAPVDAGGG